MAAVDVADDVERPVLAAAVAPQRPALDRHGGDLLLVELLDPALGVLPVAAHVPLADGAVAAGHGVGPADDPDDEVAGLQAGDRPRVEHPTE